jgi:hypothetical protein
MADWKMVSMTECRILWWTQARIAGEGWAVSKGSEKLRGGQEKRKAGWRLIKCRQKRPRLPLVTETGHATWADKDVDKQRVTTSRVLRRLQKRAE